ncbi:MAG: 50S ribosomal protein L10, partial [Pseudomonas sp.]|nr:50S ribosomal protein L10 [Pseudomonas sp.]
MVLPIRYRIRHQNDIRLRPDETVKTRSKPVAIKLEDKKAIVAEVNEAAK